MYSKEEVRKHARELLRQLTTAEKEEKSCRLWACVEAHPLFRNARRILLYASLSDEVRTQGLLHSWSRTKILYLPAVVGNEIEVRRYHPAVSLVTGRFGIAEPPVGIEGADTQVDGTEDAALANLDLLLIPGQCFDRTGNRMGRGKGYYDRFLARPEVASVPRIGIGYAATLFPHIPAEAHDRKMHFIATEDGIIPVEANP